MIINGIEVFRKQAGLTPSIDTQSTATGDYVLINFDKGDKAGGYARIRLEEGFLYFECINAEGDIFSEQVLLCSQFKPIRG
jgi:hypothetical protein